MAEHESLEQNEKEIKRAIHKCSHYVGEQKERDIGMEMYRCTGCGYIYDPLVGDTEEKIPPGKPFEKITANWKCPVCSSAKSRFEKIW